MSCYVNVEDLTLTLKAAYTGNFEKYKELSAIIESVMSLDMEPEAKIHAVWFYAGYVNAAAYKEARLQTQDWNNGVYERLHAFLEPYITGKEAFDYDMLQQKVLDFFPSKVIEIEELSIDDQIINAINDIPRLTNDQVMIDVDKIINMILENVSTIETGAAVLDDQYAGVIGYLNQLKEKLAARTDQPVTIINRIDRLINDRQKLNQEALEYKRLRDTDQIGVYNGRPLYILRKNNGQIFEVYRDDATGVYKYFNPGNATHEAEVVIAPNDQIYQFYNKNNLAVHDKSGGILRIQQDQLATGLVIADRVNVDDNQVTTHERIAESLPTDQRFYSIVRINASRYNQATNAKRRSRMLQLFPGIRRTIETVERPSQADYIANNNEPILSYGRLSENDFTVTVTNHDGSLSFDLEPVANLTIVYPDNTTELFDPEREDHLAMLREKMQLRSPSGQYVKLTQDDINTLIKGIIIYNQFKAEVLELLETQANPDIRNIFYKYYDLTNSIRSAEFLRENEKESTLQAYIDANNGRLPVKIQRYDERGNKVGDPEDTKIPIIVRKSKTGQWTIEQDVLPANAKLIAKDGKEYNSIVEYVKTNTRDEKGNLIDIPTWVANSGFGKTRKALYVTFVPSTVNPQNLIPVLQPLVYESQVADSDVVNLFMTMMYAFNNADFVSNTAILAAWNNNFWGFNYSKEKNIRPDVIISEQKEGQKRFAIRFQMKHDPDKNTEAEVKEFNEYFNKRVVKINPVIITALNDIVNRILRQTGKEIPANATLGEVSKIASTVAAELGPENPLVKELQSKLKDLTVLIQEQYNAVLQQYDLDVVAGTVANGMLPENTRKYLLFSGDQLKLSGRMGKADPISAYYKLKTQSEKALTLTLRDPYKLIILPSNKKMQVAVDMSPVAVPEPKDEIQDPGVMTTPTSVPLADDIIPESNDPFKLVQALEAYITLSPEEFQKEIDTMKAMLPKAFKFTKEGFEGLDVDGDALGFLRGLFIHLNDALRAKGVVYHEGFHGVFRNILSTNDQKYYLKRTERVLGGYLTDDKGKYINVNGKKVYASEFRQERRYVHLSDEQIKYLIYEEYLADSFAEFMESGKAPKTWMERLFAYLKMLLNFFKKQGDIENLFYDISLGKYKNAEIVDRPSNVDTVYSIKDYKGLPTITIDSTDRRTRGYQTVESYIVSEISRRMVGEMAALKATYPTSSTSDLYAKAKEIVLKEYDINSLINQAPEYKADIENAYTNHYNAVKWLLGQFHETDMSLTFLNYTKDPVNDNILINKQTYQDILAVSRNSSEQFKKAVIDDFNSIDVDIEEIEQQLDDEASTENTEDEKGESFNDVSFVSAAPGEGSAEFRKMFKYITYDYLDPRFGIYRKRTINPNTIFNTIRKITANIIDKRSIVPRILQEIDNLNVIIDDYNTNIRPRLGNVRAIPVDFAQMIELRDSLQAVYNRLDDITGIQNGFPTKNLHVFIQFANAFSTIDVKLLEVQLTTIGETEKDTSRKKVIEQNYKVSDIVIGNDLNRIRQDLRNSINRLNAESPQAQAILQQEADNIRQLSGLLEPSRIAEIKDRFTTNTGKFNDAAFKDYVNELYVSIAKLNIDIPYFVLNTILAYQAYSIFYQNAIANNEVLKADDFFDASSTYRSILRNNKEYFDQFANLQYTILGSAIANAIEAKIKAASSGFATTEQLQTALARLSEPYINSVGELLLKYDPTLAASVTKNANGDKVNKYVKPTPAYVMMLKLHQNPDIAEGLQDYLSTYFDGFQEYFMDNPLFDLTNPENKLFLENLSVAAFAGFSQSTKIDNKKAVENDPSTFRSIDDKSYALAMLGMFVNRKIKSIANTPDKLVTYKRILTQYEATSTSVVIDAKYKKYVDASVRTTKNNRGVALYVEDLLGVVRQEYNLILKNYKEEADPQTKGKQYKDYNTETGSRRGFTFNVLRDFFNVENVESADPNDNRSQRTGLRENLIEEAKKGTSWETILETNSEMATLLQQQLEMYGREQFNLFESTISDLGIVEQDYPNHPDYLATTMGRRQMLADMFFNNWIGGLQVNQLFDGPIAVGIKNYADFFKRQKSGAAAGENTDNPFRFESEGSSTYRAAVVKEIIMYIDGNDLTKPMRHTPYNAAGEENIAIKPFDGQSVNSLQRRIKIADSQGQLDSDAMQIIRRMRYLMESSKEYADGIIELRKRNIYFNSLKTVTAAGFQYFKQSEHTLLRKDVSMLRPDLNKDLAYLQLEELYNRADMYESFLDRGFDNTIEDPETGEQASIEEMYMATMSTIHSYFIPLKGRETLHVLLNSMEMDRIDQLMDPNASKRATVKPLDIDLIDLESGEGYLDLRSALEIVPNDLTFIQVETGGISKNVTQGIQQKLLIMAQLNPSDPRYKNIQKDIEEYRNGLPAAVKAQSTRIMRMLNVSDKTVVGKIYTAIADGLRSQGASTNILQFFELNPDGTPIYNPSNPLIANTIVYYYFSLFNNGIFGKKIAGNKFYHVSPYGYKILTTASGEVITHDEYKKNPDRYKNAKTRYPSIVREEYEEIDPVTKKKEKKIRYVAEVIVPKELKLMDQKFVEQYLSEFFATRIPTEGRRSMIVAKIVDYIDEAYGNSIIVPFQLHMLAGSDFDIDSLYAHMKDSYYAPSGQRILYGSYSYYKNKYAMNDDEAKFIEYLIYISNDEIIKSLVSEEKRRIESQAGFKAEAARNFGDLFGGATKNYFYENAKLLEKEETEKDAELIKTFKKLIATFNVLKEMKDSNLPTTPQELNKYVKDTGTNPVVSVILNQLVQNKMNILSDPEVYRTSFADPTNTADKAAEIYKDYVERRGMSETEIYNKQNLYTPTALIVARSINSQSKDSLGIAASFNKGVSMLATIQAVLKAPLGYIYDESNPGQSVKVSTDRIVDDSVKLVGGAIGLMADAPKNPYPGPLNLNDITTPVMGAMYSVGFPQGAAIMFQSLPIIKSLLTEYTRRFGSSYVELGTYKKSLKTFLNEKFAEQMTSSSATADLYRLGILVDTEKGTIIDQNAYKLKWNDRISPDTPEQIQTGVIPISNFGFEITDKNNIPVSSAVENFVILNEFLNYMSWGNEISFRYTKLTDVMKSLRPDQDVFDRLLNTFKELKERPEESRLTSESISKLWSAYPVLDASYEVLKRMDEISKKVMIERTSFMKGLLALFANIPGLDTAQIKTDIKAFLMLQLQFAMMQQDPKGLMSQIYLDQLDAENFLNGQVIEDYVYLKIKFPNNAFLQNINPVTDNNGKRVLELTSRTDDDVMYADLMALMTNTPDIKARAFRIAYHGMIKSGLQRGKGSFYQLLPAVLSRPMSELMNKLQDELVQLDNKIMKKHKAIGKDKTGAYVMRQDAYDEYTQRINDILLNNFNGRGLADVISDVISKIISYRVLNNESTIQKSRTGVDKINKYFMKGNTQITNEEFVNVIKSILGSYAANVITDQGLRKRLDLEDAYYIGPTEIDLFVPTGNELKISIPSTMVSDVKAMAVLASVGIRYKEEGKFTFPLYKYNVYGQMMVLKKIDGQPVGSAFIDTLARTEFSGNTNRLDLIGSEAEYGIVTKQGSNKINPLAFSEREGAIINNIVNGLQQIQSVRIAALPEMFRLNRAQNTMYFHYPISNTRPANQKDRQYQLIDNSIVTVGNVQGKYQYVNGQLYMTNKPGVPPAVQDAEAMTLFAQYVGAANFEELKSKEEFADFFASKNAIYVYNLNNGGITVELPKVEQPFAITDEFALADSMTPIEQNFIDGQGGRTMQSEFRGKSTMDLIISGDRTRTTRAKTDIDRMVKDYKLSQISDLVGKVIRMTDKTGRQVYTRITGVFPFTQEYQNKTWAKEGWTKDVTDKHVGKYPYAIEFELAQAISTNPLIEAGVKATDMSGNAAKDIQMAEESTQFIGYQSGNAAISSTNRYRLAWGDKANTGSYTAGDVIMVSASGAFRGVTGEQITSTFIGKYKPLLDKAIAAGASFRVGNQYAKGNLGDEMVANYLKQNGYAEEKLAGYSRWTKVVTPPAGTVKPGIEIGSDSKGLGAALTNPTELAKKKGNLKQSYPVYHQWLNETGEAEDGIFDDVEQAFQRFKDPTEAQTKPDIANSKNYRLMVELIKSKLEAHKVLVDGITEQGGSPWILSSTHQPTKKNTVWETGGKNWFILALNEAYLSTQSGIKPQPPATEPVENKIDKYKYYGAFYEIVTQNGVGVDVVGYKSKPAAKKKLLDAYNNNPNVDPQTGLSFRDVKPTPQAPIQPPVNANTFSYTFSNGLTIPVPFELNDEQKIALQQLESFVSGQESIITLSGAAGTGKSTVISLLAQFLKKEFQPVKYTSPTHRANAVTKMMNPRAKVFTLHALFGLSPELRLDTEFYDLKQLQFSAKNKPKVESGDILIIDESSMINDGLYEFIQNAVFDKNLKVIYVGDEAQLQPVKQSTKSKAFTNPTQRVVRLTKVERTGDNAILRESVGIRNGQDWSYQTSLNDKGEGVVYLTDTKNTLKIVNSLFAAQANMDNKLYFRILSATNKGVDNINKTVRETLYDDKASEQLLPGEIMMGYDNFERDYKSGQYQLYNGGDYQVVSVEPTTKTIQDQDEAVSINETYKGYRVTVQNVLETELKPYTLFVLDNAEDSEKIEKYAAYIQHLKKQGEKYLFSDRTRAAKYFGKAETMSSQMASMKDYQKFDRISNEYKTIMRKTLDYGYAHTIHKSQGGTYDNVMILADTINPPFDPLTIQQLKYVAISRAKKMAYIRTSNPLANRPDNKDIDSIQMEKEALEIIRQKEEESKSCNLPE